MYCEQSRNVRSLSLFPNGHESYLYESNLSLFRASNDRPFVKNTSSQAKTDLDMITRVCGAIKGISNDMELICKSVKLLKR